MRRIRSNSRKVISAILAAAMVVSVVPQIPAAEVHAAGSSTLTSAVSAAAENNIVTVTFNDGIKAKITFLEDGIFRYNVDPSGEFSEYPATVYGNETVRITQYPDDYNKYSHPAATVSEEDGYLVIKAGNTTIKFEQATAKMTVLQGTEVVMQESEALQIGTETTQSLVKNDGENFYGGGTQNGRFVHTGESINIKNESNWTDGGVASPSPFYYSSEGYGVLRNTFSTGVYDFGETDENTVTAVHGEKEYDAYYFLSDGETTTEVVQDVLNGYYHVTGNPVLLPEYAFYEGHLNAYNRDTWTESDGTKGWTIYGSNSSDGSEGYLSSEKEAGQAAGYQFPENSHAESLNGTGATVSTENIAESVDTPYKYSARAVIDQYVGLDMPLGYFLPNDGYGAGYGQNGYYVKGDVNSDACTAVIDANVQNLADFTEYARKNGVEVGLWTQSYLTPQENKNEYWHLLRDFNKEVTVGGVTTLKTDVAWVGNGYDMALNAQKTGYNTVTTKANYRANVISLDGWAGTQRFAGIWTGDQYGGDWEYIRFHIPTYIGQSLSGNPNIGSDMDGIFGGKTIITTRDTQWKIFTPLMLNMDGWGSYAKTPYTAGDPYTGINRMYLKLKAQLLPYIYTSAASAANIDTGNDDTGLPMIRAMFLEYPEDEYASTKDMQYQYMFGENILVAPVYTETENIDEQGNDVRNGIYLPDEDQIWIDYFTGDQYYGGQVLNGFDAPIWKLPVFVKNGAIIPMWEENNNPASIDKSNRITEFWPDGSTEYTLYEDDGTYVENTQTEVDGYGTVNDIDYGDHVSTRYTSVVENGTATLTAEKSTGTYEGYDQNKNTTFIVNVSKEPTAVIAKNGETTLKKVEKTSKEEVLNATVAEGTFAYYYDESPAIETYAVDGEDEFAEMMKDQESSPKLYVKFAETDAKKYAQVLTLEGFENTDKDLASNVKDTTIAVPANLCDVETAKTPTSNTITWDAVKGAVSYDLLIDGVVNHIEVEKDVTRLAGDGRLETSRKVATALKETLGIDKFENIVVATSKEAYDALAGSYLAIAKNAPILLTNSKEAANADLLAYVNANAKSGAKIYILGGTKAVSADVKNMFTEAGYDVEQLDGQNRLETNKKILDAAGLEGQNELVIVTSKGFADSLSASATGRPILLVNPDKALNADQKAVLDHFKNGKVYIIGGESAVSDECKKNIEAYLGTETTRIAGNGRYITSVEVAKTFFADSEYAVVATGNDFPDGLCGGPLAAALGAPLLLTRDGNTKAADYANEAGITSGYVLGGKKALADDTVKNVFAVTNNKMVFTHADQEYHSTHTYQVRARKASGYSEWSDVITATTLEDPWRNVPSATITWNGGDKWGALSCATDHDTTTMFHSTDDVVTDAVPFIMDFGAGYTLDKFEYYPRDNFGNGTVKKMEVSISLDGIHWTCVADGSEAWTYDTSKTVEENVKTVDFNGQGARYVKLVVKESVGNFFSANELAVYKADGSKAFAVGSTNNLAKVSDADYTNMKNYLGMSEADGSKFVDQIQKRNGDINYNGVYDVYDYAFTMFKLDGGTTKTDSISGSISYEVTEKDGNVVINVKANDVKNLNAFGQVLNYDPEKLTFVSETTGDLLKSYEMEDLTVNKVYENGNAYVNLAYANRGDKALVNGSGVLATITLTANAGGSVADIDLSSIMLLGPDFSCTTVQTVVGAQTPTVSTGNVTVIRGDQVTPTLTNSKLTTDDGSNVTSLIQLGNYNGLFDGTKGRDFEFKWDVESNYVDGSLPEEITLPLTMSFALNEEAPLNQIVVYNANKANGYVTKAKAVLNFSDGTSSEVKEIALSANEMVDYAAFDFNWYGTNKTVKSVDVTICEAINASGAAVTNMLTLAEIELGYNDLVPVTAISAEGNAQTIAVEETKDITAVFTPANATNPYFKAESSDPSVAQIVLTTGQDGYVAYQVKGIAAGTATITLTSLENAEITASYTVTVSELAAE